MLKYPKLTKINGHWLDYILLLSSLIIIWGAIIYYLYALNTAGIILTGFLTILSFFWTKGFFLRGKDRNGESEKSTGKSTNLINYLILNKINLALIVGYFILVALAFYRFCQARSDRALISPWQVINYDFFWFYALSALVLTVLLSRTKIKTGLKLVLISVYYFLSFGAAVIIYKIGYGFDPFIHQATMELIAAKGVVLPKTPYYLGEYSLIIILSKISGLTIYFLNKFLVPALAALFLPAALFNFLKSRVKSSPAIFLTILFLLILSFSPFIATTPQNLSYLFLILAVLSAASSDNFGRTLILSLASAAIHPLAGLPAIALTAFIALKKYEDRIKSEWRKIIKTAIWLFTVWSIPTALFFSSGAERASIGGGKILLASWLNLLGAPTGAGREDIISNFIYLLTDNYPLIIILIIISALWYVSRSKNIPEHFRTANRGLIFISSALLLAYFLSGQIIFDGIINYEQSGYANRLLIAIIIFLLPSLALLLENIISRVFQAKPAVRIIWLGLGLSVLSASLYVSYPRFDKYFNSRGYSTGANDIAAVNSIDAEARAPYIVLANQPVSVAALQSFGFNHYYQTSVGELYFYPIPTGSPLYQYYLDMVYKNPDRASLIKALDLAGVDNGYLVVNKYWNQSGRVIGEAKLTADKWWTINNEVFIFKYER
ncbi:MAG: hypothetical protein NTY31_00885 [Candidatus Falkowbacteria bacterium]|nr:hypothetical protein [Candidatus Falkowbacteria bacterium]